MKTFIYYTHRNRSGREFVIVDDITRTAGYGNTAATALNFTADTSIEVRSIRQLRDTFHDLLAYGYKEVK